MMRRLLAGCVLLLLMATFAQAAEPGKAPHRALIIYDGTSLGTPEGSVGGMYIANLLGHFEYQPTLRTVEKYHGGEMAGYDAVFVVGGSDKTVWPSTLLRDARARTSVFVWLGYGAETFLGEKGDFKRGLQAHGVEHNAHFNRVRYKGVVLGKGSDMLIRLAVTDKSRARVESAVIDQEGRELPYVVRIGQTWVIADTPFAYIGDRDRYLVFCDLMHDMLGVEHATARQAMIRLEDVNPDDDPDAVQRAVDVFVSEGIPFQISLVPIYVDPTARQEIRLSERPELVAVLHRAVARGGTIVLHGYTHQYRGVTPDDFEFWDAMRNGPRTDDSADLVRRKLTAALDECFRNDLYPVAWETPHYAASPLDYAEFRRVFSTINESPMIDRQGAQQTFPFATVDMYGTTIVPENVGFLPEEDPSPAAIVGNARALLVVRDGIASAFVHDFLNPRLIREVVQGIKRLGYTFISIRDFQCRVSLGDRVIATAGASRSIALNDEYLRQFVISANGVRRQESWSEERQSGSLEVPLSPAAREVLVAIGTNDRPEPPLGPVSLVKEMAVRAVSRASRSTSLTQQGPQPMKAAVLWQASAALEEAKSQASFANLFRAFGVSPRLIPVATLPSTPLNKEEVLVVPHAAAASLSSSDVALISRFVREGGQLVLDDRSPLAVEMGIGYPGLSANIEELSDVADTDLRLRWRPAAVMDQFRLPTDHTVLMRDSVAQTAVVGVFRAGAGKVLYLGAPLDPYTEDAISRYPFLFQHILDAFNRTMVARSRSIELYFDPGLRTGISIEDLAVLWRRMGVRVVYAAAWSFSPQYTYDYDRLLRVCHANGILVYAWFELPQVSPGFWAEHPEWREVTASGGAYPSWRLAMNLANPDCRTAALQFVSDVLRRWDWDGVNLAELNFDGDGNGDLPREMAPLNTDVRRAFRASHGFDPMELFNRSSRHWWRRDPAGWKSFLAFRASLVTDLHRTFLTALRPFAASGHEIIVTAIDSLEHPEVMPHNGVDSMAIIGLLREFPFTLQVEDPARAWKNPPSRYLRLANRYRSLLPPGSRFMMDINVVNDRDVQETHLPLSLTTGVELAATVRAARTASDRVAIYGDATVRLTDLDFLAYAGAGQSQITPHGGRWSVETPTTIEIRVPPEVRKFYREGEDWPYGRSGYVLLPAGHHQLTADRGWFSPIDPSALRPQLMQVSAPLLSAGTTSGGRLMFEYDSPGRVLACLSRRPGSANVDGQPAVIVPGAREFGAVLILPAGHHRVEVAGSGGVSFVLDMASLIFSSLTVAFGSFAILALMTLYTGIRVRRFFLRRGR